MRINGDDHWSRLSLVHEPARPRHANGLAATSYQAKFARQTIPAQAVLVACEVSPGLARKEGGKNF
jgi:hypothetical protein